MAGELSWMIIAVARDGRDSELEAVARRAAAWTKGNEPGVREYAWRISPDTGACAIYVKIGSPEAAAAYLKNFEERFQKHLLDCVDIQHTLVFCDPPAAIRKRLELLKPVYMEEAAGYVRAVSTGPSLMR